MPNSLLRLNRSVLVGNPQSAWRKVHSVPGVRAMRYALCALPVTQRCASSAQRHAAGGLTEGARGRSEYYQTERA